MGAAAARATVSLSARLANSGRRSSAPSRGRGSGARNSLSASPITCRWCWSRCIAMGASDERLEEYCHIYQRTNGLVPVPARVGEIDRDNWRDFLASASARATIALSSPARSGGSGRTQAAIHYLPQLFPGFAASATARVHAHGLCDDDRQRRGDGGRARLLGRDLSAARRAAGARADHRRSGGGARLHVRARDVPRTSRPSATCCGTSCARRRASPNSRRSSTCSRSGRDA